MAQAEDDLVIGIIAGDGALPRLIAEDRAAGSGRYLVVSFRGASEPWMKDHPHAEARFERPGALFALLRQAGCNAVVLAGGMARPSLSPWRYDLTAWRLAPRVLSLLRLGDDAMLRGLASLFEEQGFRLIGAEQLLGSLLASEGPLGRIAPLEQDQADAARAVEIAAALGAVDVGQAVVVAAGLCLGVEAIEGTDALLRRVADLPPGRRPKERGPCGVLFKAPKPGQDRRMDLPAIGPESIRLAHAAGLRGVAIEAGGVFVLDMAETVAEADRLGVALWGVSAAGAGA